jgi:short-subunit dehydrogenase
MAGSEIPSQLGKTAVVTGATGGLGYETALACVSAWNKDPVFGVIGIQSGPRH